MSEGQLIGWIALSLTTAHICVGLPSQIRTNHCRRSCEGLSLGMFAMWFCNYASWAIYGVLNKDLFIIAANVPGSFLIIVVLGQFIFYSHRNVDSE